MKSFDNRTGSFTSNYFIRYGKIVILARFSALLDISTYSTAIVSNKLVSCDRHNLLRQTGGSGSCFLHVQQMHPSNVQRTDTKPIATCSPVGRESGSSSESLALSRRRKGPLPLLPQVIVSTVLAPVNERK